MTILLPIQNFPKQQLIYQSKARYTIVAKGRRFGLTKGSANDFIKCALEGTFKKGLWVDTVNTNIDKYIERYFIPHLNKLPKSVWTWRKQAKMIVINESYIDFRSADTPECYDKQTEVLTEEGWKYFKDLSKQEKVFTLNPDNLIAEWKKPRSYVERYYDGAMKHFYNKKIDLLVTPNHNFLIQRASGKRLIKQIQECNSHDKIPASVGFKGQNNKDISNELCAFIGFYLAEGSHDKNKGGYRIRIAQTEGLKGGIKGNVRNDFLKILNKMKIRYSVDSKQISIINKKLWIMIDELGNTYTKFIPRKYKELSLEKLKIIIEWLIKGDGTVRKRKGVKEEVLYTVSKQLADDFQEILVKIGKSGRIYKKSSKGAKSTLKNRTIFATTDCWGISVHNNKFNYFSNGQTNFVKDTDYQGFIYCLEVENRTMLVRRNGKICWSGNTMEGFGYDKAFLNEAGIILKDEYLWNNAIMPMFWDYPNAKVVIGGTPKGRGKFYELYQRGLDPGQTNYKSFHYTSFDSPFEHIHKAIREDLQSMPERVVEQEIYARFLEDTGVVFRNFQEVMDAVPQKPQVGHRYIMGVDLAKVEDFTVIAVYDTFNNRQVYQARFNKIDWGMQKSRIAETARHFNDGSSPRSNAASVVIDATGLGDPIVDDLARMGIPVDPIKFTNDMKRQLIEKFVNWIELKRVHILPIQETKVELGNFTYDISETTDRIRYEAPVGFHDDIVIAHALAIWRLNIKEKVLQVIPKTKIRLSYERQLQEKYDEGIEIPAGDFSEWGA